MHADASKPLRSIGRRRAGALALLGALLAGGCTGLEPAAIGVAVTGVQTGVTMVSGSRMWSYEYAGFEHVVEATRTVTDRLGMERVNERDDSEHRYWSAHRYSPKRRLIEIEIRRQTDVVTSIRIDVGSKAQRGMAALLLREVFAELRARGAYPETELEFRERNGIFGQ